MVAKNGGHLASNLGSTELAIALHYLFDSRTTRLSGTSAIRHTRINSSRAAAHFHTIRQYQHQRLLPARRNPDDIFNAGHAGTSISAGLGIAV